MRRSYEREIWSGYVWGNKKHFAIILLIKLVNAEDLRIRAISFA
jgi:hypothetical protein